MGSQRSGLSGTMKQYHDLYSGKSLPSDWPRFESHRCETTENVGIAGIPLWSVSSVVGRDREGVVLSQWWTVNLTRASVLVSRTKVRQAKDLTNRPPPHEDLKRSGPQRANNSEDIPHVENASNADSQHHEKTRFSVCAGNRIKGIAYPQRYLEIAQLIDSSKF